MRLLAVKLPAILTSITAVLILVGTFQNCAQGLKPIELHSVDVASVAAVDCLASETKSCDINDGTAGMQTCSSSGQWDSCVFSQCKSGFYKSGNVCLPMICTPNARVACQVAGGSGFQNCAADGSSLGACVANQCAANYRLVNGVCEPNQCTPGTDYACAATNGMGLKTCTDGVAYSSCRLMSCNLGYYKVGENCLRQLCSPNTQLPCGVINGVGARTCSVDGSAYGSCLAVSCNPGYDLVNGACRLAQVCAPNSSSTCQIPNGVGNRICSASGSSWGNCTVASCNSGFALFGNTCIAQACSPNTVASCVVTGGSGTKKCNAQGTGYGLCMATSCASGYTLSNGQCVPGGCTPGNSYSCQSGAGSGTKTCNGDGRTYSACSITQCIAGYYLLNGSCHLQFCSPNAIESCTVFDGTGEKTCNANGSAFSPCRATSCRDGYVLVNNQCLACMPNSASACPVANGVGTKLCSSAGNTWGQCQVTTCNSGFVKDGNTCVAQVCQAGQTQSCAIAEGSGSQACLTNAGLPRWDICRVQSCNAGYQPNGFICEFMNSTVVGAVDPGLGVDMTWYKKQYTINGLPVIGSANVTDAAFFRTRQILEGMLSGNPNLWSGTYGSQGIRRSDAGKAYFIIIGADERTENIPEYRHDPTYFNNDRARGWGGVWGNPVSSSGEENILCLPSNRWYSSSILVHEMAHQVMNIAYRGTPTLNQIDTTYTSSIASGKWANTYAGTNSMEYFAVGSSAYFDAAQPQVTATNNGIWNRSQLQNYDPSLGGVLNSIFGSPVYRWQRCN